MGKTLAAGIFLIVLILVAFFVFFINLTAEPKAIEQAGREAYDSDNNFTLSYPNRWQIDHFREVETEPSFQLELVLRPKNTSDVFFYVKYPYSSGGMDAYGAMKWFEKQKYQRDQTFTSTISEPIYSEYRDAHALFYKTGAGESERSHRKIMVIDDDSIYEMEYFAPVGAYRVFEDDANNIFNSFKLDWELISPNLQKSLQ